MKIVERDDERAVKAKAALEKNDGYCPCKVEHIPKNKCKCRDFMMCCVQHDFYGTCKCGLWEKVHEDDEKQLLDDAGRII